MTVASIQCPKCENGEIEFEHYAGSFMDPPEDDMTQDCECDFTDAEYKALAQEAWEHYGEAEAQAEIEQAKWEAEHPIILCPVCGGEPPEHNWEVHYAELRA